MRPSRKIILKRFGQLVQGQFSRLVSNPHILKSDMVMICMGIFKSGKIIWGRFDKQAFNLVSREKGVEWIGQTSIICSYLNTS